MHSFVLFFLEYDIWKSEHKEINLYQKAWTLLNFLPGFLRRKRKTKIHKYYTKIQEKVYTWTDDLILHNHLKSESRLEETHTMIVLYPQSNTKRLWCKSSKLHHNIFSSCLKNFPFLGAKTKHRVILSISCLI